MLVDQNVSVRDWPCFIGGGVYNHYSPVTLQGACDPPRPLRAASHLGFDG
jgi:hypothetical protein